MANGYLSTLKKVKPTKRYLITKHRALKKHWRKLPKEEKYELKRLVGILIITLLTITAVYFLGIKLLANIGNFWRTLRGQGGELFQTDTTVPPPPYLSPLPRYTNRDTIKVEGYAEAGTEVTLFVNNNEAGKTIADKGGYLSFPAVTLQNGENEITAIAKDGAGNESLKSSALKITLDKEPPELTINQPSDGQSFAGNDNKVVIIGQTELGATVKVNDSQASVLADGSFTFTLVANQVGNIKITIVATDRAGNETKKEVTVTYSSN